MRVESATIKITNAATMTMQERKDVAAWLTDQAHALVVEGNDYDKTYTARYLTEESKQWR